MFSSLTQDQSPLPCQALTETTVPRRRTATTIQATKKITVGTEVEVGGEAAVEATGDRVDKMGMTANGGILGRSTENGLKSGVLR
mmetsp:Transcript_100731/g.150958  ORF Transcript_100731/g.150958 Transcript_100731/m.150958 type:complete len:85 (+) Transcript_100731:86-340(+)